MKFLIIIVLALLLSALGSGFIVKGIVFSLGILAGTEIVRWAKRRQARIGPVTQITIGSNGGAVELTGTILYYNGHWELNGGLDGERCVSYDQGATWKKVTELAK